MKISFITLLLIALSTLIFQGCRSAENAEPASFPGIDAPLTEAPFSSREPEKYQFEVWQTTPAGTDKFFAIRSGAKWRIDSAYGTPEQVTSLHTDKDYVIVFAPKIYAEIDASHGYDEREATIEGITRGMINGKNMGVFEKLATTDGITTYKMTSDAERGKESIFSFDEKAGLAVKKEVYKTDGGRVLESTVTLSAFKTDVDEKLLALPVGFKKVPVDEIRKALMPTPK